MAKGKEEIAKIYNKLRNMVSKEYDHFMGHNADRASDAVRSTEGYRKLNVDGELPPAAQRKVDKAEARRLKSRIGVGAGTLGLGGTGYAMTGGEKTASDKAEQTFQKIAQSLDRIEDYQTSRLHQGVDAYNKRVKGQTAKYTGGAAGAGAAAGAGGAGIYSLMKNKGTRKALMNALKGGGVGAGVGAAGALGYLLPKAMKAYVTRDEERQLTEALDEKQDAVRMNKVRDAFRNYAARLQDNDNAPKN